ncbi:MAG: hypothetical protein KKA73_26515 [Chloroflexi bacterium]|nr:hypothetical protein [Chloroflexota bacterium]
MDAVTIPPEDVEEYNAKLDEFYQAYAEYLQGSTQYQNLRWRTIQLAIKLINEGTVPAQDIDIFMHFPNGFDVLSAHDFPPPPRRPQPPSKPKPPWEKLRETLDISPTSLLYPGRLIPQTPELPGPPPNVTAPDIERTSSYSVHFHVRQLKHNLQEPLEPLCVIFESFESAHSFHIDYQILAANVPSKISGNLHVITSTEESQTAS